MSDKLKSCSTLELVLEQDREARSVPTYGHDHLGRYLGSHGRHPKLWWLGCDPLLPGLRGSGLLRASLGLAHDTAEVKR